MSKEIKALVDQWIECRSAAIKDHEKMISSSSLIAQRLKISEILARWTNINHILLHAGEMTAAERRTVLAVTNTMARQIRAVLEKEQG